MRTLLITKEFQTQIDTLHRLVGNIEWSGVLFYKTDKHFSEPDCQIIPEFIFPMDIGTSAATDFNYGEELMDAYDMYEGAEACREGIIHTHHTMGAFHSQTDISELNENAKNYDWYLSLVVDLNKTYKTKVAIAPTSVKLIIDRPSGRFELDNFTTPVILLDVDVVFEEEIITESPMIDRINGLIAKSKAKTAYGKTPAKSSYTVPGYGGTSDLPFQKETKKTTGTNNISKDSGETKGKKNQKTEKSNKKAFAVDKQYEFLAKWIDQDLDSTDILYTVLSNVVDEYDKTPLHEQADTLEMYESELFDSFDEFFEDVYGLPMDLYVETMYNGEAKPEYMIDKFKYQMTLMKDNVKLYPIVDSVLSVLETLNDMCQE